MEDKETNRLEAFSDGVFAVAITLLVLNLKILPDKALIDGSFWRVLGGQLPALIAFVTSFATIGIMWTIPLHHSKSCYTPQYLSASANRRVFALSLSSLPVG